MKSAEVGWFQIDAHTNHERGVRGMDVRFGAGRVAEIGAFARERGLERAMLVTGSNLKRNSAVMEPVRQSLGDLIVGEFSGASPDKHISTVYHGIEMLRDLDADLLVGIGGGGSLDTARQISGFAGDGRGMSHFQETAAAGEGLKLEGTGSAAVVLVPTTLAGADLSVGGSIEVLSGAESPDGLPQRMNPPNVSPIGVFYDPNIYETTPASVLAGSAMNGLDKGIETLYSPLSDPFSEAVSSHGLTLMARGLLTMGVDRRLGLSEAVAGMILVQLRVRISVIHAFGHAIARNSSIQQGVAHAVLAPHVIGFLLEQGAIDPSALAGALRSAGATSGESAEDVVEAVVTIRDSLGLPGRLSDLEESAELDLKVCADAASTSSLLKGSPLQHGMTSEQALHILEGAW